jgi:hypothetical protein
MENVLSLQMLSTDVPVDNTCSNSSVSCPSNASCYSHDSVAKASGIDQVSW